MRSPSLLWLLACASMVSAAGPAFGGPRLAAEVDALLASARGVEFSVCVEDDAGARIYSHQAERPLVPASNMKLLTTAAALYQLGPGFSHSTRLVLAGEVEAGVLAGDLVVVGGGDPTHSRRFDQDPLLDDLARAVAAAGIARVEGALVADDRAFDAVRLHPDWEASDAEHWYGAEVSALSLNDNCIDVLVGGGASRPTVALLPDTRYVTVALEAKSIPTAKGHVFSIQRRGEDRRTLRVRGKVYRKAKPYESSVPVADPSLFFATVLHERLAAHGVAVGGGVRRALVGEALAAGRTVWERKAPLLRTLGVTNKRSQNLYAECLLKTLGRRSPGGKLLSGGSWTLGSRAAEAWAKSVGVPAGEVDVADGSGLARSNRLSARALVVILRAALGGEHGAAYRESLAVPGEKGTLRKRLRDLPRGVTACGKTGTLTGVSALSGELAAGNKRWRFSLLANGQGASRRTLDKVVRVLAGHLARG